MVVMVAVSSLARIWGESLAIRSPPALSFFFFLFFKDGDQLAHTDSTLQARISLQWLSERRLLWRSVPRQVTCELVSG